MDQEEDERKPEEGPVNFRRFSLGCQRIVFGRRQGRHRWLGPLTIVLFLLIILIYNLAATYMNGLWISLTYRFGHTKQAGSVAVFYHVFIPPNKGKKGIQQSLDIVREQLTQITNGLPNSRTVSVYYTTTGVYRVAKHEADRACHELGLDYCYWMGHWKEGQEELTLNHLHEYCHYNEDATVVYLHTKGSFHSAKGRNHAWRWHLTKAALTCASSSMTMNATATSFSDEMKHTCNVCGLQFYPVWTTFFPGNMFSASCEYVNRLWAPHEFATRLDRVVKSALANESGLSFTLYNASNPGNLGLDRYAMEHWIASHPSVRPCEVLTDSPRLDVWYETNATQRNIVTPAPQHNWREEGWFRWNSAAVQSLLFDDSAQLRKEFFLLPGYLFKWRHLYSEIPPKNSWVWHWYPDGDFWKNSIYGGSLSSSTG